jgi:hypothetical protein
MACTGGDGFAAGTRTANAFVDFTFGRGSRNSGTAIGRAVRTGLLPRLDRWDS